jgi:radical SAM superfamily enzyme YgiQ (UPF0313 family)
MPLRKRSVDNIFREIEQLLANNGVDDIVFYDDCLFYTPVTANSEISEFCEEIQKRGLKFTWQMELRPDLFMAISDVTKNY